MVGSPCQAEPGPPGAPHGLQADTKLGRGRERPAGRRASGWALRDCRDLGAWEGPAAEVRRHGCEEGGAGYVCVGGEGRTAGGTQVGEAAEGRV